MFTKTSMLVAGTAALVLSVTVWAVTAAEKNNPKKSSCCPNIVDANGNGICDRKEDGSCPGGPGPGAGCGQCQGAEKCPQFVDENKNGICDRKEQGTCAHGQGCGKCGKYTDEDGNGVCDLKEQGACSRAQGAGCGQGGGCRQGMRCGKSASEAAWAWDAASLLEAPSK